MLIGWGLFFTHQPSEKLFFLLPKEAELSKKETPSQKDELIKRKYKNEVKNGFPEAPLFHAYAQKIKQWLFDPQNGSPRKCEDRKDKKHLP